ncbi:MAG: glycerol-3-phosphate dehydrogenase/oxidase [Chloroflexi bacterium]|nr:glycerol-3-phosphate dehydrogenase/oxidase [Chloroflexota bacterium]MYF21282.1 glycerol-3-phosphate dehydrogenase/oxidase [Chloroflexota bacterium]
MTTPDYDVIIIGGGINGVATASSVAARGYRTLVLEQDDFASGTTSASTKLIHGGLRYLETGDARLVHESLQSRERLLRERSHLVRPMGFILPVYEGDPRPPWYIRSGLALYDVLSPRKVSPWHSSFSRRELQRFEPSISTERMRAAYLYYDAQVWSPERLTLEYLAEARGSGADLRNHAAVDYIIVDGGRARGVDFHDVLTGRRSTASGRLVINAAGPWVDAVLDATGRSLQKRIGGTRGSHLVLDLEGRGPRHAVLASAQSDGRPMFVTPWLDHHIVGTTDVRDDGNPSDVRAAGWEIDYLIAEAARVLPGLGIEHRNALYAYSGVRPLARAGESVFEGAISRRSFLVDHASEGVERLLSIVGGKLTTASALGAKVSASVAQQIGRPRARGIAALPEIPTSRAVFLTPETHEHLRMVYGQRAPQVAAYAASDPTLAEPISGRHRDIGAQVLYAVAHEHARTVADVLLRRTIVGLTKDLGRSAAAPTAAIMAKRLGWSDEVRDQAVRDYFAELHCSYVVLNPDVNAMSSMDAASAAEAE